jgi:anamorsin
VQFSLSPHLSIAPNNKETMKSVLVISQAAETSSELSFVDFSHPKFEGAELTKVKFQLSTQYLGEMSLLSPGSFDEAYVFVVPDDFTMTTVLSVLKPSGKMLIETCIPTREAGQELCGDLQLQGFVDTMSAKDPVTGDRFVTCSKPSWETGDVAAIKLPQKTEKAATAWKMGTDDLAEDDLVDEDELLDDNLEITVGAGCGIDPVTGKAIGKKKACKNCSCGLKEMEQEEQKQEKQQEATYEAVEVSAAPKSSCGSCYKGDAFRCASCPFLGKPAFEPTDENKRVMLSMGDDI